MTSVVLDDVRIELVKAGLMTVAQVSEFLGIGRSIIYELMADGALPFIKIGRARRIPRRAVLEFAAGRMNGAIIGVSHDRR